MERAYQPVWKEIPRDFGRAIMRSFVFNGRSRRHEAVVYLWLGGMIANVISTGLFPMEFLGPGRFERHWAHWIVDGAYLIPIPALLVRRFHDQDRSGWFGIVVLLIAAGLNLTKEYDMPSWYLIPGILTVMSIIALTFFAPGTAGPNRFGPDPRLESIS